MRSPALLSGWEKGRTATLAAGESRRGISAVLVGLRVQASAARQRQSNAARRNG